NLPYRSWRLNFQTSVPLRSKQARSPLPTKNQTCLPSVEGEAEEPFPSSPRALPPALPRTFFHTTVPSVLTHSATRLSDSSPLVKKILSFQTHGVAPLMPGIGNF